VTQHKEAVGYAEGFCPTDVILDGGHNLGLTLKGTGRKAFGFHKTAITVPP